MTDASWNLEDYLLDFPDVPRYKGPPDKAPLIHKMNWIRIFLLEGVLPDAQRAVSAGSELAGLVLALAAVDYLAGYFVGRQTKGCDYEAFMGSYFPKGYEPMRHDIYVQLRNGLMHNLVCLNPWTHGGTRFLIHPNHPNHLSRTPDGRTVFSVGVFVMDIARAWVMYSHDLVVHADEHPDLVKAFERRFNRLEGQGAFMERSPD